MITKLNISCTWGGHLAGILLKNFQATAQETAAKKIIGVHGWLDNLNSLLPLAQKLIEQCPNHEIYLFDRAGHGFSSHLPKSSDYSYASSLRDLRIVTKTLGWDKEKFSFIGHSYGGHLAMIYAATYPEEVSCLVTLDALLGAERSAKTFWKSVATRIDDHIRFHNKPQKTYRNELTHEKALELVRNSRIGIDDNSAKLLVERSIRRDKHNKLHFTRDEALRNLQLLPFNQVMAEEAIMNIQASVLFMGAIKPQWPISSHSIELLKKYNKNFQTILIDGSHHFHMAHADIVAQHIKQYFENYFK